MSSNICRYRCTKKIIGRYLGLKLQAYQFFGGMLYQLIVFFFLLSLFFLIKFGHVKKIFIFEVIKRKGKYARLNRHRKRKGLNESKQSSITNRKY